MVSDSQSTAVFNVALFHTLAKNVMINNTAKVTEVKNYIYNVSLLFICNELN